MDIKNRQSPVFHVVQKMNTLKIDPSLALFARA